MSIATDTAVAPANHEPVPVSANGQRALASAATTGNALAFLVDAAAFNHLWRVAVGYAKSTLVPTHYQGSPENCFIMCQLGVRMGVDPFMLMQSSYIVHGRPGFEAKLAIAMLNSSGKIRGTLKTRFEGTGEDYGCRAWAIDRDTGEKIEGPRVDWKMVKGEGWNVDKQLRNGGGVQKSKWNTMPDLMFVYRAATFFIRTNYPEVLMGMRTTDEIEDTIIDVESVDPAQNVSRTQQLTQVLKAQRDNQVATPQTAPTTAPTTTDQSEQSKDEPQDASDPPFNPPTEAEMLEAEFLDRISHSTKADLDAIGVEVGECRALCPEALQRIDAAIKAKLGQSNGTPAGNGTAKSERFAHWKQQILGRKTIGAIGQDVQSAAADQQLTQGERDELSRIADQQREQIRSTRGLFSNQSH